MTAIANKMDVIRWSSVCLIFLCSQGTKAEMLESVADATLQVNAKIEEITERVNKDIPDDEDTIYLQEGRFPVSGNLVPNIGILSNYGR